jgi:membrane protease YdiL (CAAX protease family)
MHRLSLLIKSTPLLIALSIFVIYCEFSIAIFYTQLTGISYNAEKISAIMFFIGFTLLCAFTLPALTGRLLYKETLTDLGVARPKYTKTTIVLIILALLILMPCIYSLSQNQIAHTYYSLGNISIFKLAFILLVIFPVYYFAEEFFFRGFLFNILWKKVGWHSFWISDILFTIAHLGKPLLEILIAIPASVIYNYLSLHSKSIFPSMFVHYVMAVSLIILVNYA